MKPRISPKSAAMPKTSIVPALSDYLS
jgi:hypothetical protein